MSPTTMAKGKLALRLISIRTSARRSISCKSTCTCGSSGTICVGVHFVGQLKIVVSCCRYPAKSVAIITSYNGQRALIEDIINARCSFNPLYGRPASISTVDKFQGEQSDYVLLSLVRTKTVGHIRDLRRLTVALSRARLGLYVFGRQRLFQNCLEMANVFLEFGKKPMKLDLVPSEKWTADFSRKVSSFVRSFVPLLLRPA